MIADAQVAFDNISEALSRIPPLPPLVRYWDDFAERYLVVRDLEATDVWAVQVAGQECRIDFSVFAVRHRSIFKHCAVDVLAKRLPGTATSYLSSLASISPHAREEFVDCLVCAHPNDFRHYWIKGFVPRVTAGQARGAKAMLRTACFLTLGAWSPDMLDYVSLLPGVPFDKYAAVRTGECFLPLDVQSEIIGHIDRIASLLACRSNVPVDELRRTAILVLSFQYGLRAGQIASLSRDDVVHLPTGAVHVRVALAKQRGTHARRRVVRSIKREWCLVFAELLRSAPPSGEHVRKMFGLTPSALGRVIQSTTEEITGEAWTGTDLRHSAAQRLADAGVSHESLTEFMGHSDVRTANVYFDASPTQAHRLNQALGLSDIYGSVAEVARSRFIDKDALLRRPPETIIAAAPHGIPVSGIGSCMSAQSLCTRNPVLSCYTCHKFLPVSDPAAHQQVLDEFRPVVLRFAESAPGGQAAPAMMQLRATLSAAQRMVDSLNAGEEGQ